MGLKSHFTLIVVFIGVALVGTVAVTGLMTNSKTIGSLGTVKAINVEVYSDSGCTIVLSDIDWGTLNPGDSMDKTVYVKNTGNYPMSLSMSYSGWDPVEVGNYITLSWYREGATLNQGESFGAVLTLSVSDTISGITSFSFNIVIEGTG